MYDQSINTLTISRILRRSDFNVHQFLKGKAAKEKTISDAVNCAANGCWATSPLLISSLRGKNVYSLFKFSDELIVRKINQNVCHFFKIRHPARTSIVSNLSRIVAEGVPYRIYKLDVKNFYESFSIAEVQQRIDGIGHLSSYSKKLVRDIFKHFVLGGGKGIPRGLAISATLSELMMSDFDKTIRNDKDVFFYSRYVDDIIIVTSGNEPEDGFIKRISKLLPTGLELSRKKRFIKTVPKVGPKTVFAFSFEYLGYKFSITDSGQKDTFRKVVLDIAESKIKRIKTRIILALHNFSQNGDFDLLRQRINFLSGNFGIPDEYRAKKRLAGIYYNYHLMHSGAPNNGLTSLDRFLRTAILSSSGRVFSTFFSKSTYAQRKKILSCSFKNGFDKKYFLHYSASSLNTIQECWKYA